MFYLLSLGDPRGYCNIFTRLQPAVPAKKDRECPCATGAKEKDPHLDLGSRVGSSDGRTVTAKSLRAATAAALVPVLSFCLSEKCKRIDQLDRVVFEVPPSHPGERE